MSKQYAEWIDWVELGCRGWSIDESGAELGTEDGDDFAHVDWETGHIMFYGSPRFCRTVFWDVEAAGVVPAYFALTNTTASSTTNLNTLWATFSHV